MEQKEFPYKQIKKLFALLAVTRAGLYFKRLANKGPPYNRISTGEFNALPAASQFRIVVTSAAGLCSVFVDNRSPDQFPKSILFPLSLFYSNSSWRIPAESIWSR